MTLLAVHSHLVGLLHRRGRGEFETFTVLVNTNDPARVASVCRQMPNIVTVDVYDRNTGLLFDWLINLRGLVEGRDFAFTGRQFGRTWDGQRIVGDHSETMTFFFKRVVDATYFKLRWC